MATFFCVAMALTLVAIAVYPRSYTSESKLFLRVGRESVSLDPTATTGQTIMLQKTQVDEVNSALQVLTSREVYKRVVERIGADRIVNDLPPANLELKAANSSASWTDKISEAKSWGTQHLQDLMLTLHLSDPGTAEEMAIRKLDGGVRAYSPKESTVITVSYAAASPQLAHDVVEAVTNIFLDEHVRVNHSEGSLQFFSDQSEKLHKELTAAQAELRDRKNEFQISSIESRRLVFGEQMKDVELQLLATDRELAYSDAEIADLKRAIGGLQPELVTNRVKGFANEGKDLMREKLYELEIEESKLRSRYADDHPLLQQIQRQRKEAESILTDIPAERTQTTSELNPNQRKLELDLLQATARKEALSARKVAAQKQIDGLNTELQALNGHEMKLEQLERDVQILDGKYRMHVDKLEQARVNDELGREHMSNIKVAQSATLVGKPTSPKKALLLAFGLATALGGAFALPFVFEIFDETLRTTAQVESELGLPVLLSFPKRKRKTRSAGARSLYNCEQDGGRTTVNNEVNGRYRTLVRELVHRNLRSNGHPHATTVGIVGCETSKARSRVASELAIQAASCGVEPVLLIDADARHRRVAKRFRLNGAPGWREVLAGVADAESCVHRANRGTLAVMTAGGEEGKTEGAQPQGSRAPLDAIKAEYGFVVVDMPPATQFEAPASPGWLDEVVLVVEAERTRTQSARRAKEMLERAGARLVGVVLANEREHIPRWLSDRL